MRDKIIFAFWVIALFLIPAKAEINNSLENARKAYEAGRYLECAEIYDSISKADGVSAALLANMGNAYAKAGDYGHAFLCYERSLYLDPSNKEVRNNRAFILSKIEDGNIANAKGKNISVVSDQPTFFTRLKNYITHSHTSNTWAIWGGVFFVLVCGCIAIYLFRKEVLVRKIGFFGAIAFFALSVIFMLFSIASAKECDTHNQGVIVGYKVLLMTEPLNSSKTTGTPLERGTKLDILEMETDNDGKVEWYKVRLNSEFAGWIQASEFEVI